MKRLIALYGIIAFCFSCSIQETSRPTGEANATDTVTAAETITDTSLPSVTPTATKQQSLYQILTPGRYIVYETDDYPNYPLNVVSETGVEQGRIYSGEQAHAVISPDNKKIAFSTMSAVMILNLKDNSTISLPDRMDCFHGTRQLAWGPDSETLAINCAGITVIKVPNGEVIGHISNKIYSGVEQSYNNINWSPNGRWISYELSFSSQEIGNKGPYITEVSCMIDIATCPGKSKRMLIEYNDYPMTWTPGNHLAILDTSEDILRIYDATTDALLKTFIFPDTGYFTDYFAWSPDEEWFAVGGGMGPGIYVVSITTGEYRTVVEHGGFVRFWLTVP
jgi:WD40 repeat protein